jgi:RHS repeat-associated protein
VRGSVRLVVSIDDGSIAQRLDYDAFGRVLSDSSPGFQPFGFAGGIYDHRTQLVLFGFRSYDPFSGRFLSRDPLWHGGGHSNLYLYVANDPVNFVDPDGLWAFPLIPVFEAAVIVYGLVGVSSIYNASQGNYDNISHQIWSGPSVMFGAGISVLGNCLEKRLNGRQVDWDIDGATIVVYDNSVQQVAGFTTTWGNLICYNYDRHEMENPSSKKYARARHTRDHEFEHVKQSAYLGPFYLPLHAAAGGVSLLWKGNWHDGNLLEMGPMSTPMKPWWW